jgi:hypothetical protein
MRDNGYKNAAYALAELIDNSVQAGADSVQLMCFEHVDTSGQRNTRRVNKIAIFDNGKGMNKDVLHLALEFGGSKHRDDPNGMGKFGMGLPNSSISQCQRVDVWSWEKGQSPSYTYLDIKMMMRGKLETIPYPIEKPLPPEMMALIGSGQLPESGTFILWSELDRLQWKTSHSIYRHSEAIVGRMYRKFIAKEQVKIRFQPYLWDEKNNRYEDSDKPKATDFRVNDPLYLTANTSLPALPTPMTGEVPFEIKQRKKIEMAYEGKIHTVELLVSMIKPEVLSAIKNAPGLKVQYVGATEWGKHMATNASVSVVRADRELETRTDFFSKDFLSNKARFMGVEVNFSPGLDKVFGVLNNKQAAVNFQCMDFDADAEQQGFDNAKDYEQDLKDNNDPKLKLYEISRELTNLIKDVSKIVNGLDVEVSRKNGKSTVERPKSEIIIESVNNRRGTNGKGPDPDIKIKQTDKDDIVEKIKVDPTISEPEAKKIVEDIIENEEHFKIQEVGVAPNIFFDVSSFDGLTLLQLNKNHAFYKKLMANAPDEQKYLMEVCLGAWARMENESLSIRAKEQLEFARQRWGDMLHEYLTEDEE